MTGVLSLPFDQYQRYRLVADLLDRLREGDRPLQVLDVGGRTAVLRDFLKQDAITLVDMEASGEKRLVLGDGCLLPFQDESFDVVAAFDTLEHIRPARRKKFVRECWRVTRKWTVIAGPYRTGPVEAAENTLERFMSKKLRVDHRYLREHIEYRLPLRAEVESQLAGLGGEVLSVGHGNLDRWLALMCMSMYMDSDAHLRSLAKRFFRFYNKHLYSSDHASPVYRHVIVAAYGDAALPDTAGLFAPPRAPEGALRQITALGLDLAGFDRAKEAWKADRKKLVGARQELTQRLEEHGVSLKEIAAECMSQNMVIATLRKDLSGHSDSLRRADRKSVV
jgi:hypothetical protein